LEPIINTKNNMAIYEKPEIEIIEVEVEAGFNLSLGYSNDELDFDSAPL